MRIPFPRASAATLMVLAGSTTTAQVYLRSDGTIVIWGGNVFGEQDVPTLPTGVTFVEVAAGKNYTLARLSTGQVIGWGSNIWGQANPPGGPANVTRIAAGETHSLALRSDGSVTAWGQNALGLLSVPVLALPIPNNLALLGYTLACQGIAFTQATAFGLMTSNGMTFTLNY